MLVEALTTIFVAHIHVAWPLRLVGMYELGLRSQLSFTEESPTESRINIRMRCSDLGAVCKTASACLGTTKIKLQDEG